GLDGWTLTERLKCDAATADIPVAILSAHVMPFEKQRAIEAGCDVFLEKPCLPNQLDEALRNLLRRRAVERQ
ncbi:MAG TPA: response regulator, partial [Luteitalea sp.]|nr:response regulator [Luteitalea sp.]